MESINATNQEKVIELQGIRKVFGEVIANNNVNLDIYRGEILSILGENGSGKTTAMNVLSGLYAPDGGKIFISGEEVTIKTPKEALDHRIGMVHQHFKLVDVFTALENIVLGLSVDDLKFLRKKYKKPEYVDKKTKLFDLKEQKVYVSEMCKRYGFALDLDKHVYDMSVSEKQTLEIVKVLYRGVEVLILDEPTAVLTPQEIRRLFEVVKNMKKDGKSIVIITHKLNEVMEISDRVAIFRKGDHITTLNTSETNEKELADLMVGEKIDLKIHRSEPFNAVDRLFVNNLTVKNSDGQLAIKNVSFTARSGEILGIAGISGSGQKELLEAVQGLRSFEEGEVIFHNPKKDQPATFFHKTLKQIKELAKQGKFHDKDFNTISFNGMKNRDIKAMVNRGEVLFYEDEIVNLKGKNPREIRGLGIRVSFVPEDRLGMGLVSNMSLTDNIMLRSYRHGHWVFLDREKPKTLAEQIIRDLNVSAPNASINVSKLSGGNVQKILVGREIALVPKVFMAAYPVRGLDINSSYLIYNLLDEQKRNGVAVIYVGEDLDVLLALCDRILVLCDGRITGIVDAKQVTKDEIGLLMTKHEETSDE